MAWYVEFLQASAKSSARRVWSHTRIATFLLVSDPRYGDHCCLDNCVQQLNTYVKVGTVLNIFLQ